MRFRGQQLQDLTHVRDEALSAECPDGHVTTGGRVCGTVERPMLQGRDGDVVSHQIYDRLLQGVTNTHLNDFQQLVLLFTIPKGRIRFDPEYLTRDPKSACLCRCSAADPDTPRDNVRPDLAT